MNRRHEWSRSSWPNPTERLIRLRTVLRRCVAHPARCAGFVCQLSCDPTLSSTRAQFAVQLFLCEQPSRRRAASCRGRICADRRVRSARCAAGLPLRPRSRGGAAARPQHDLRVGEALHRDRWVGWHPGDPIRAVDPNSPRRHRGNPRWPRDVAASWPAGPAAGVVRSDGGTAYCRSSVTCREARRVRGTLSP